MPKYVFQTTSERSLRMSNIKGKNTIPEITLRKALWAKGIRYRINVTKLPGKPDIVVRQQKLAIFVDGEFWHGFNWSEKKLRIKSNADYWIPKIERNMERDLKNNQDLQNLGFTVIRLWEQQITKNLEECVENIYSLIKNNNRNKL